MTRSRRRLTAREKAQILAAQNTATRPIQKWAAWREGA